MTAAKEIRTGRPPGRPRKFAEGRVQATVRLSPQRHADLKGKADAARRSVSEEIEARLERLAAYDSVLAAMGSSLDRIKAGSLEAELWRSGFVPIRHPGGKKLWAEPGYPGIERRAGFIAVDETEPNEPTLTAAESDQRVQQEIEALRRRVEEALAPPKKPDEKVA
jgi:hypothetical protein